MRFRTGVLLLLRLLKIAFLDNPKHFSPFQSLGALGLAQLSLASAALWLASAAVHMVRLLSLNG